MYTNHQSLVNTIWKPCQQAQQSLEEANISTGRDFILQQEIETQVLNITWAELHQRMCRPTQFHFKEMPFPPSQPTASFSQTLTTCRHPIWYTKSGKPMRCYKCNSRSHIEWNCQLYVYPLCGQRQPGHAQKNCPDRYYNDRMRGHFDIGGEETGNYIKTLISLTYLFQNQMVQLWYFFLPFSPFLVSHYFHSNIWIYCPYIYPQAGNNPNFWTFLSPSYSNKKPCLVFYWWQLFHHVTRHLIWTTLATFPNEFDGDCTRGQAFLCSCQTYMLLCPDSFSNDQTKIIWGLLYMKSGRAAKWAANWWAHLACTSEIGLITLIYSSFKLIWAPAIIITLFWPLLLCCNCLFKTKNYQSMFNQHFAITTRIVSRNHFVHKSALYQHGLSFLEAWDFDCSTFPQVLPVFLRWKQLSLMTKASQGQSLELLWQSIAFKLSYSKVLRAIVAPSFLGLFSHAINQNS